MQKPWCVLKFGGTSVSGRPQWETIEGVVRARLAQGYRVLVVCSAVSGVTSALERALEAALRDEAAARKVLSEIGTQHDVLSEALEIDSSHIDEFLDEAKRVIAGVGMLGEASPKVQARLMAMGELMSTRLGAAFLLRRGLWARWVDARQWLVASDTSTAQANPRRAYLSALCGFDPDPTLQAAFGRAADAEDGAAVLVTQGFIARNAAGETVLLGRGGSDTSASYFAAKLDAAICEIWTDVPGMFSANPRHVPQARLLKALDYEEAQEIASTGAKVLHPRCLPPLRARAIPLVIGCTQQPHLEGTRVSASADGAPQVKALSTRSDLTLLSMESLGMWQEAGFLADVFACFKGRGLSVDLVSTSETNVTVSLDPLANALDAPTLAALVSDLEARCKVQVFSSCAAISLVGRQIKACLHKLGPVLSLFEEQRVYMVTQSASDLNLTFVVDEAQLNKLVRELHALLFDKQTQSATFGPSWQALFPPPSPTTTTPSADPAAPSSPPPRWWVAARPRLLDAAQHHGCCYVYDEAELEAAARGVLSIPAIDRCFYAIKANNNPDILRCFARLGLGFECVSWAEVAHVRALLPDLPPTRLFFTPNFAPRHEYAQALAAHITPTLDNLHPLDAWPSLFEGRDVFVRLDPGKGQGHHAHVKTAGAKAKFGISPDQLDALSAALSRCGARVVGLHAHTGSGVRSPDNWQQTALFLAQVAQERFPHVTTLNLGGGLGVPERPSDPPLDLPALSAALSDVRRAFPAYSLWLEPGRYLVARAGVLLATVTQTKRKGDTRYVGLNTGMNSLIRPALYGAFHDILNLSHLDTPPSEEVNIVGPICETGDTLGYDRRLPPTAEGDVLLIDTAGAYGHVMSSHYNMRPPAVEVFLPRQDA